MNKEKKSLPRIVIVHVLVATFGLSAWIGVNSIFIQLPILINTLPEGWNLAVYLTMSVQLANVAPMIYSLFHKYSLKIDKSKIILKTLCINCLIMILVAFFYDETTIVFKSKRSTALLILTFLTSIISCTSSVLFMPYLKNFKEIYMISYFIGEGLSGVVPSVIALFQGIGKNPTCNDSIDLPKFTSRYYFFLIFITLFLSFIAFYLLKNLSCVDKEKKKKKKNINKDVNCQSYVLTSSDGLTTECEVLERHVCRNDRDDGKHFIKINIKRSIILYFVLGTICLLSNGFLPSLGPFSSVAYDNDGRTYHFATTLSQIANPVACFFGLWYLPQSQRIIYFLTILILITSSYITYLALSSPNLPFRDNEFGKTMVIFSWIVLTGLFSYVKLIITSVFQRKSDKTLFKVGLVMQFGSAGGAVLAFILINFTSFLQKYEECN